MRKGNKVDKLSPIISRLRRHVFWLKVQRSHWELYGHECPRGDMVERVERNTRANNEALHIYDYAVASSLG